MPSALKSILNCFCPATQAEEPTSYAAAHSRQPETSSPRASGALAGLAPRRRVPDGECQLGGYLMGREAVVGPVEGADFDLIRSSNRTVMQTREALRYGRGNVIEDIRDSGGQSTVRAEAGRRLGKRLPSKYPEDVRRVAGAMTAQAGNCRDHAEVAAFLYAPHLREGEEVYTEGSATIDHAWAEWRGQGSDGERRIAMDPWGKGPAIFAEDGEFSGIDHESRRGPYHYDHATGAQAHAKMEELQQRRHDRMQSQLRREMKKLGPDYRYGSDKLWAPTPVVSPQFAERASRAMFRPLNTAPLSPPPEFEGHESAEPVFTDELWMAPLRQQIHATEMARRLDADGVQEITRAATRIAHVAADLRRYPLESHPAQFGHDDS